MLVAAPGLTVCRAVQDEDGEGRRHRWQLLADIVSSDLFAFESVSYLAGPVV